MLLSTGHMVSQGGREEWRSSNLIRKRVRVPGGDSLRPSGPPRHSHGRCSCCKVSLSKCHFNDGVQLKEMIIIQLTNSACKLRVQFLSEVWLKRKTRDNFCPEVFQAGRFVPRVGLDVSWTKRTQTINQLSGNFRLRKTYVISALLSFDVSHHTMQPQLSRSPTNPAVLVTLAVLRPSLSVRKGEACFGTAPAGFTHFDRKQQDAE